MKPVTDTKVFAKYPDGKTKIRSEKAFSSDLEDAKSEGAEAPEIIAGPQTFGYQEPTSVDEILTCVPNEVEALNIFLYGLSLKAANIEADYLKDENFQAVEGSLDISKELAEVRERKKMSPLDKAAKLLGIDPSKLAELVGQFAEAGK